MIARHGATITPLDDGTFLVRHVSGRTGVRRNQAQANRLAKHLHAKHTHRYGKVVPDRPGDAVILGRMVNTKHKGMIVNRAGLGVS